MNITKIKNTIKESKSSVIIGVIISSIFTISFNGLASNIENWIFTALFGGLFGFIIHIIIAIKENLLSLKNITNTPLRLVLTFGLSYFSFSTLGYFCYKLLNIPFNLLDHISIGVSISVVMVDFFYIVIDQKNTKLKLEQKNKELAVIEERNRIARELHDSVSQTLFGINLNLNTLEYLIKTDATGQEEITAQLKTMVSEVQTEMRLMIYELKPLSFKDKGFFESIEDLITLFRRRYQLNIEHEFTGNENGLDNDSELAIYRVIQESLNNIVKHAQSSLVTINLHIEDNDLSLSISDNGIGFDLESLANKPESCGVQNMKERIKQIGGNFEIKSALSKGTSTLIEVDLNKRN